MSTYQKVTVVGYAGKDASMSFTQDGSACTTFSVAVSDYAGKDKEGKAKYRSTWFNVVVWNKLAEIANELVHKGGLYLVEGRLSIQEYEDREGNKRTSVRLVATEVKPIGKKVSTDSYTDDLGDLDDHPF